MMNIGLIYAFPGPLRTPMSVRATEGIFSSVRFLLSHSEIFDFSLSAVEADRLRFHDHPSDSEANSLEPHIEKWCLRLPTTEGRENIRLHHCHLRVQIESPVHGFE